MSNFLFYLLIINKFGKLQRAVVVLLLSGVAVKEEKEVRIARNTVTNAKSFFDDASLPDTLDGCIDGTEVLRLFIDLMCTVKKRDAAWGSMTPVYQVSLPTT